MANYGGFGYQYETSPKKLQPEYVPTKKAKKKTNVKPQNTKKPSKQQKNKYNYKPVVYIGLAFVMLFTISYRYSLINEEYNSKVSIENSLNLSSIEKAAQDKLGMQKLDNNNKIYLDLQKKDYVEPASEEVILNDNSSWFEKLIKKLTQIIK